MKLIDLLRAIERTRNVRATETATVRRWALIDVARRKGRCIWRHA